MHDRDDHQSKIDPSQRRHESTADPQRNRFVVADEPSRERDQRDYDDGNRPAGGRGKLAPKVYAYPAWHVTAYVH